MVDSYDIPIIARGKIIAPGEDAVEFGGRGGAKFRVPDPHKHINDLVLGNPVLLNDLLETPIREIVDFLGEVGKRLYLDDNPYLQESFALSLQAGGLPESILKGVYDALPAMFNPDAMSEMAETTIGIRYLDGWARNKPPHENVRVRAVGTRQLHITAGNVPVVAALTIIRGALTKSDVLIKSPANDPLTANAIARTLLDVDADHPLSRHIAVGYWKGGDEKMDSQIVRTSRIDKITAWGGMASVKNIQKYLSPGIDLTALNPKYSISIVGKAAFENEASMSEVAVGLAAISAFFNQTACSNTRIVYVECDADDDSIEKLVKKIKTPKNPVKKHRIEKKPKLGEYFFFKFINSLVFLISEKTWSFTNEKSFVTLIYLTILFTASEAFSFFEKDNWLFPPSCWLFLTWQIAPPFSFCHFE